MCGASERWCELFRFPLFAHLRQSMGYSTLGKRGKARCFPARERARKKTQVFGCVHGYEHEHVRVVVSKVRLRGGVCLASRVGAYDEQRYHGHLQNVF